MKLPQVNAPKYTVDLISKGEVKFRPFLVKEQKVLLMAAHSKDQKEIMNAVVECISNCTDGKVDATSLPVFDLMMLFLQIRAKSVGEVLELQHSCDNTIQDGDKTRRCATSVEFEVNLDELQFKTDPAHNPVIQITDEIGVKMKYPSLGMAANYANLETNAVDQINMIVDSMVSVFTEDEVTDTSDVSREELIEFLDSMTSEQIKKILEFFQTQPSVEVSVNTKCKKCGNDRVVRLRDFEDFF